MSQKQTFLRRAYVFHMGSLGDGIVHWPLYRAMCRGGWNITLVGEDHRVKLAADEVNSSVAADGAGAADGGGWKSGGRMRAESCELRQFRGLWCGECEPANANADVDLVIAIFDDAKWLTSAKVMFPGARIVSHGAAGYQPDSPLWREFDVAVRGQVARLHRFDSAIVMHLGAGAESKRWPMQRFLQLQELLAAEACTNVLLQRSDGSALSVQPIFGEVELERFTQTDRDAFARMCRLPSISQSQGPITRLPQLANTIRLASVFIGCDTGPTHLAAQLGVPIVALYSAEQTDNWLPRGPRVDVVQPECGAVENITAREVLDAVLAQRRIA